MPASDQTATDISSDSQVSAAARSDPALRAVIDDAVYADRLRRLAGQAGSSGADVILISPGADLRYFIGHSIGSHERFSCLTVTPDGAISLLVPLLERPAWVGTTPERLGLSISTWHDGEDPYATLAALLPAGGRKLAVDYYLPAVHAVGMRTAMPGSDITLAGPAIGELRMRKDQVEVAALAASGAAIDRVQQRIGEWLRVGRTERAVAADIAAALVQQGHAAADFVIVGSGPNGASPHHQASDRVIESGDAVVIDIGGPSPAGYFSDCTRTYSVGNPNDPEFRGVYEIVRQAQAAAVAAAVGGATCEAVDAAARTLIQKAGYGQYFVTRTGHGIGLEVHEHPYLVSGNSIPLEPGMSFSVEPGIYLPGRFGVRIEDIVVIDQQGAPRLLNNCPTELIIVDDGAP